VEAPCRRHARGEELLAATVAASLRQTLHLKKSLFASLCIVSTYYHLDAIIALFTTTIDGQMGRA
jgi:hypothetical protein